MKTLLEVRIYSSGNNKVTFTGQIQKEEDRAVKRWLLVYILDYKEDPRKCQKRHLNIWMGEKVRPGDTILMSRQVLQLSGSCALMLPALYWPQEMYLNLQFISCERIPKISRSRVILFSLLALDPNSYLLLLQMVSLFQISP